MSDLEKSYKRAMAATTSRRKMKITAYWDETDTNNHGWSWRAVVWDLAESEYPIGEDSGGIDGTKRLSLSSVARRVRRAIGSQARGVAVHIYTGHADEYIER
jgi:hypothetical protein